MKPQNLVNHVVFLIDESGSMEGRENEVINFCDDQVRYLSAKSQEMNQETRVSIFKFHNDVNCVVYDMDVMRAPSLKGLYKPDGGTALRDAVAQGIDDLKLTPTKYGDHAFLFFVVTDGDERHSRKVSRDQLKRKLAEVSSDWTITAFVPNRQGISYLKDCGFNEDLISIWEISKSIGTVGEKVKKGTDTFFTRRAQGQKAGNIFKTQEFSAQKVVANLDVVDASKYMVINIRKDRTVIKDAAESWTQKPYVVGSAYYQLTKKETIQANKNILVKHKKNGKVYEGDAARQIVGLPNYEVKCEPSPTHDFEIFVQSTSTNRLLYSGTELIVLL